MDEPIYPVAAVGYRVFRSLENGQILRSVYSDYHWLPGNNTAECDLLDDFGDWIEDHEPPYWNCECGLQAFHNWKFAKQYRKKTIHLSSRSRKHDLNNSNLVIGLVAGSGRLAVHGRGWRAANAQLLGVVLEPHQAELATAIEDNYGVLCTTDKRELFELKKKLPIAEISKSIRPKRKRYKFKDQYRYRLFQSKVKFK